MIEKKVISGKTYANIDILQEWDKNPRFIDEKDFDRLKRQITSLGLYKPLLVTEHGIVIGGNMRLRAIKELVKEGTLSAEVPITEIAFAQEELPSESTETARWKALIDGKVQEKLYDSQEQIMIEYALSDNDTAGRWETLALTELLQPYQQTINLPDYKLELGYPVSAENFLNDSTPAGPEGKDLPNGVNNPAPGNENPNTGIDNRDQNQKMFLAKFTPVQWQEGEIEQRLEMVQNTLGLSNDTDVFMKLLEIFETANTKYLENPETPVKEVIGEFVDPNVASADLSEREQNAQDTVAASSEESQPNE